MPKGIKRGAITLGGDQPITLEEIDDEAIADLTHQQHEDLDRLSEVYKEYRASLKSLVDSRYGHLLPYIPKHIAEPGNILVVRCDDGVVVRFDKRTDEPKLICACMEGSIGVVCTALSQSLIRCNPDPNTAPGPSEGVYLGVSIQGPDGRHISDVLSVHVVFDIATDVAEAPAELLRGFRPIASIHNTFEIALEGEVRPPDGSTSGATSFVTRTPMRLPVGWECIEIYNVRDVSNWEARDGAHRAETDLLAAVAARQFRESQFLSLDPNADARRQYASVLREFKTLLDSRPQKEETLQVYLREHPFLICPTFVKLWPKLPLGKNVTDFVFQDANGEYLLVELEKSTHELFRSDGHAKNELNVARGQIVDWRRYLEDNLRTVQNEQGLAGISASPRSLIVIGRRSSLSKDDQRKLQTIRNLEPTLEIITYDELYDRGKAVIENLLGPLYEPGGDTRVYFPNAGSSRRLGES